MGKPGSALCRHRHRRVFKLESHWDEQALSCFYNRCFATKHVSSHGAGTLWWALPWSCGLSTGDSDEGGVKVLRISENTLHEAPRMIGGTARATCPQD